MKHKPAFKIMEDKNMKKALVIISIILGLFAWTVMSWFAGMCSHEWYLVEKYGDDYEYKLQAMNRAEEICDEFIDGLSDAIGEMYGNN